MLLIRLLQLHDLQFNPRPCCSSTDRYFQTVLLIGDADSLKSSVVCLIQTIMVFH